MEGKMIRMECYKGNNRAKVLMEQGKPTLGSWLSVSSCQSAEVMSYIGFDWLVIDMEHAPHSFETVENMIRTIERTEVVPMVRVSWNDPVLMKLALDRGAKGIVVPWVNTKEEAAKAVSGCMFPPKGLRGIGGGRTTKYDLDEGKYMAEANDDVLVIIQIETISAVDSIDEIFEVEGLGGAFIGPADLSASMGMFGQLGRPEFEAAVMKVLEAGKRHKVPVGIHVGSNETAAKRINQGFQFMAISDDIEFMINGAKSALSEINKGCGNRVGLGRQQ